MMSTNDSAVSPSPTTNVLLSNPFIYPGFRRRIRSRSEPLEEIWELIDTSFSVAGGVNV